MIDSSEQLKAWLEPRPIEFAQIVAARTALRVMPYGLVINGAKNSDNEITLALFRANFVSWAVNSFPSVFTSNAAYYAATRAVRAATDVLPVATDAAYAARVAFAAARAAGAADASSAAAYASEAAVLADRVASNIAIWNGLAADCKWLESSTGLFTDGPTGARLLTRKPLWLRGVPAQWETDWAVCRTCLFERDSSWRIWTDWYDRRITGHLAAFDIPKDTSGIEDRKILARLADTNESIWESGYHHINNSLQKWIEEARSIAWAPPSSASAWGDADDVAMRKSIDTTRITPNGWFGESDDAWMAKSSASISDDRNSISIDVFFSTCRKIAHVGGVYFGSERSDQCTYGISNVSVPANREFGGSGRPFRAKLFSFTLFEAKEDEKDHFIINKLEFTPLAEWRYQINISSKEDAFIFVHGFNVSFKDALFRAAQIFYDLQYEGIPILFSWASRGSAIGYLYDKDSADHGEIHFIELLAQLAATGIRKVHILAHSMGNALVIGALERHNHEERPLGIAEFMMAAPDVDCDVYAQKMPALRKAIPGLTLYASAADKALALSKTLARDRMRAGDISDGKPVLMDGIDAIDITAIGSEIFGTGHGAYASTPSILNDIGQLVNHGQRPPNKRLSQIRGMPEGANLPKWWKFVG